MKASRWSLLLLWLMATAVWAAGAEVVELRYRTAEEMTVLLQPHLESGESVSGLADKLVLRLKPENRESILALIRQIDKRPDQLMVSVRQGGEQYETANEAGVSGRYRTGRGEVQIGDDPRPLSGRIVQYQTGGDDSAQQRVRVLDGQEAAFYVGHLVPVPGDAVVDRHGYVRHGGIYYQRVTTGFVVRPRMAGERVLLEISPQREQMLGDGRIAVQHSTTTIETGLGQWVDIGAVIEQFSGRQQGLTQYGSTDGESRSRVEVMVERESAGGR